MNNKLAELGRRLMALFRRTQFDADLEEEMQLHQELREQEQAERGVSPEEARYAAQRRFGNKLVLREESHEMWGWNWLETLLQDIRFGLRQLRRNPGFTTVATITLALGIGANTAIFTLVHAVMLKSLPVANPNQLYRLGNRNDCCVNGGLEERGWDLFPYSLYVDLRDHTSEFSDLAAFQSFSMQLTARRLHSSALASPFQGEFVSGNYFRMFGIGAFGGRVFTPGDDRPGAPPVAVMSYRTWQKNFGLDPSVIGGTFAIDSVPFTVVGIAPPRFFGDRLRSDPPDFWLPVSTEPVVDSAGSILKADDEWLYSIGRLKPGAKPRQVQSELTVELRRWLLSQSDIPARDRAKIPKQFIPLAPAGGGVQQLQDEYASGLRLLIILAGIVLLIACANITNLLLARGAASRLNAAVRVALGAPRRRLFRQVLTGSVLLAILGGLAGLYVAYAGTRTILMLAFRGSHYVPFNANPSLPVLAFAFVLSLVTGVVFGLVPAWINTSSDPADVLRGASRSVGDQASLARRSLVVLQVALCTVLLASAGLLAVSLRNLQNQPYGFQAQGRWIVKVDPALAGIKPDQLYGLYHQLGPQLEHIPGVLSASYSLYSPMEGDNWSSGIHIEGRPDQYGSSWLRVGPHYSETVGTPLIRGRTITEQDTPTSRRVAVVNQAFAGKFFPHQDPIGQHFGIGGPERASDLEIVGIVGDARYSDAREPASPTFFIPFLQLVKYKDQDKQSAMLRSNYAGSIELRVTGKPHDLEAEVQRALANINPNLTVLNTMSLGEQLSLNFNQDRLMARLTELFGLLALVLSCVGLYGVTSYSVARRTNEIGIRMALGAGRKSILVMILRGALSQIIFGVVIGVPVALACARLLASLLYGVNPSDPLTFVAVSLVLVGVALSACYIPARRATRVDPMVALRHE
jgi:macrolide transport system ATP-binding/permease protein